MAVVAFAGNPNVGKSTIFNALTGMKQHTGNWAGKTVNYSMGTYKGREGEHHLIDLPGCYSLSALSEEEKVANDFICLQSVDYVVVVCDATCIERNLNLVLQIMEMGAQVIVCVNLLDEAKKKGIDINLEEMEEELQVPVVGVIGREKKTLHRLIDAIETLANKDVSDKNKDISDRNKGVSILYPTIIEEEIRKLEIVIRPIVHNEKTIRWLAVRLLEQNLIALEYLLQYTDCAKEYMEFVLEKVNEVRTSLQMKGYPYHRLQQVFVKTIYSISQRITQSCICYHSEEYNQRDRRLDRILTSKMTGIPIMIVLVLLIFWLTIVGANYPSTWLSNLFAEIEKYLVYYSVEFQIHEMIYEPLIFGVYRVVTWVVSVMLPPMAIFFPLFTILEDFGYLPRIAFNMDRCFSKCQTCGKQALTMCMGFGCNAVGVTGSRIIDSPKERLIAILTNTFVPCNGRFPTIIAIITIFLALQSKITIGSSLVAAFILLLVIFIGVVATFYVSKFLSKTILKGVTSTFTLELPPYRMPQFGKVILRSIVDRTLLVLGRAVMISAPMGLCIWIMANINFGGENLLTICSGLLQPFGELMGLDGAILLAFILGFPANEIVFPIVLMIYLSAGEPIEMENLFGVKEVLLQNGWTLVTACNMILFSLFHWPCGTTLLTIRKETNSRKWTAISFVLPTLIGVILCIVIASISKVLTI